MESREREREKRKGERVRLGRVDQPEPNLWVGFNHVDPWAFWSFHKSKINKKIISEIF